MTSKMLDRHKAKIVNVSISTMMTMMMNCFGEEWTDKKH